MNHPAAMFRAVCGPRANRTRIECGNLTGAVVAWLVFATMSASLSAAEAPQANTLTPAEQHVGWRRLFDGESTQGWRTFRTDTISPGWKVIDGALVRAAAGAGDIVTADEFDWFELQLDYRISPGGNSGIMFRVTEDSPKPWHSGPEVQVLDNASGKDPQRAGWLYGLYPPRTDPLTKKPIDATRPAGEWNTLALRIAPEQCEIALNGIRYATFKIGSADWDKKVAASKFAAFPQFGKAPRGRICLQDHGDEVAYRNIRIRELRADAPPPDPVDGTLDVGFEPAFPGLRWDGYDAVDEQGRPQTFRPVLMTHAGDGSRRIFVVEQHGVIHVIEPAAGGGRPKASRIFADLRDRVVYADKQNEEGLLGLAFHPRFADTGECFVYYTSKRHDPSTSVVARLRTTGDRRRVDPATEEELLVVPQPFWNHNGGTLAFGPDGKLYVALGDGGSGNDPYGHAQNLGTLFGSILRIDVDRRDPGLAYAIPSDNPFVGMAGARGEIWAHGLRNVWRMAFDRATGLLWAADVGQGTYEEIDIIARGGNYGWNLREGRHAFGPRGSAPREDLIDPVFEYDHSVGASITGGFVYRGRRVPQLEGRYLYADYVSGKLFALSFDPVKGVATGNHTIPGQKMPVLSWGEDEEGEAYFMVASNDGQGIYRLAPNAAASPATSTGASNRSPFAAADLSAWRTLAGEPVTAGWEVVDGVWHLTPGPPRQGNERRINHTIVTADEFEDFSLTFTWRIAAGGNGGIKYRVRQYGPRWLGCEYQILDDPGYTRPLQPVQSAAALYGLFAPPADKPLRPAPEWNTGRIVVRGDHVEHWLHGRLMVSATVGDAEWDRRVAESKFDDFEGFGRERRGRLMLTDHGAETWLRDIVFTPGSDESPTNVTQPVVTQPVATQPASESGAAGPEKIRLWPEGAPGAKGDADIDQPFVEVWRPAASKATGAAFVICPGGGYGGLAADHEGRQVAKWCTDAGAVAFVLHYRLGSKGYHYPIQLLDVQRALRFARAGAHRYGIAPDRIGVFGFSAGGHLASMAATLFDEKPAGGTSDAIDGVSARPDVAVLAYPVIALAELHAHRGSRKNLLGPADTDDLARTLSTDRRVTAATPPTFIFQTDEDPGVPAENAVAFYLACRRHGVPAELHVYRRGPHGVGLARGDHTLGRWSDLLRDWLRDRGFFRSGNRVAVKGRATVDGVPVSWGTVVFRPDDPLAPVSSARIRNGSFTVDAADGPVVGPVTVTVCASTVDVPGLDTADGTITFTESAPGAGPWRLVIDRTQPALDLSIRR